MVQVKLVCVTWTDACFDLYDEPDLVEVQTVGYIVRQDEEAVCVANEYYGDTMRGFTIIPMVNVEEITTLEDE